MYIDIFLMMWKLLKKKKLVLVFMHEIIFWYTNQDKWLYLFPSVKSIWLRQTQTGNTYCVYVSYTCAHTHIHTHTPVLANQ